MSKWRKTPPRPLRPKSSPNGLSGKELKAIPTPRKAPKGRKG